MKKNIIIVLLLSLILISATGVLIINGDLTITGDLKYNFKHAVGSADSVAWATGSTQNVYYKINTGAFVSHEADEMVILGDSIQTANTGSEVGDYLIICSLAITSANQNDKLRGKLYINNVAAPLAGIGRWIINSNGAGLADASTYFWYKVSMPSLAWISVRVANQSASRAMTVQDFKLYVEKKPE